MEPNEMIPTEIKIWNAMTPGERLAVMNEVGVERSVTKTLHKCLAHIKEVSA